MHRILSASIATLTLAAASAFAGIVDSPIPAPFTQHVFSVSGVVNNGSFGAYFSCMNADTQSVTVGVEVFGPAGGAPLNIAAATATSVAAGATGLFGTNSATALVVDANLAPRSRSTISWPRAEAAFAASASRPGMVGIRS